jgi:hypothetical protein
MTFLDLQNEVKRRATRDQSGGNFDVATKNLINNAIFRIANETPWRVLRREASLDTVATYTTGTVSTTVNSATFTFSGADLITNGVQIGRRLKLDTGSTTLYTIKEITGENTAIMDLVYDGTTAVTASGFTIYGQEVYNLPIQTGRVGSIWHEGYKYPIVMEYITERAFVESGCHFDDSDTPLVYWMWGEDWTINQPRTAGVISAVSSSTSDNSQTVTIFGTVSGYPDSDTITLDGTTSMSTAKLFTKVERVVKDRTTVGRITVSSDSAQTEIAVLPVGDTTAGIKYKKFQMYPSPDQIYKIKVLYYKEPYRLVGSNDVHELGQDFDELIILLATARMDAEQSKSKDLESFFTLYTNELTVLRRKNADKLDWLPNRGRPSQAWNGRHGAHGSSHGPHQWLSYQQMGSKFGPSGHFA